jgi:hypothetical protein
VKWPPNLAAFDATFCCLESLPQNTPANLERHQFQFGASS